MPYHFEILADLVARRSAAGTPGWGPPSRSMVRAGRQRGATVRLDSRRIPYHANPRGETRTNHADHGAIVHHPNRDPSGLRHEWSMTRTQVKDVRADRPGATQ